MKEVLLMITDGFADWEAAYVTAELNQPGTGFRVRTIAIDLEPKVSMGGLRVLPDYSVKEYLPEAKPAMLIISGGTGWGEDKHVQLKELVAYCTREDIPVAAICDATTFLARHGFLDHTGHTGNTLPFLKEGAPSYRGEAFYTDAQSVSDGNLITANGSGALEFSAHILEKLGVLEGEKLQEWYTVLKKGYFPA
ncbi:MULTISPECIES: type 1 glutamine amidotransferase family protein [Paenibacillus]|uniref:type 1 glutamine amidotransferase family protein n=1 Tax=Paenibacillus TaxID=44249 RepID=UPI0022B8AA26|nr:type 1 glutamine amidotransferase family protein [Paenibacillus caseinilyticus]MCZ8523956.1 glutamine amidotransferase [Paenibacillus caseinilyticus]